MAKISRLDDNVQAFAVDALSNERTIFGTTTTGDDTLDNNVNADFLRGWGIVGPSDEPTREDFNALGFVLGQFIAYLHQVGLPEWNGKQEYHQYSIANEDGTVYVCRTNNHTSVTAPSLDTTNWEPLLTALKTFYDNSDSGLTADNVKEAIDELANTIISERIGVPFPVFDHIPGCPIPDNSGAVKYIKLTAGEDGAGEYNEGLLTSEIVTGSAPDIVATAVIDYSQSPMNGQTISLINTERRIPRPGESGTVQGDAIRNITGTVITNSSLSGFTGVFGSGGNIDGGYSEPGAGPDILSFDASLLVPTADENRMKNIGATYYMRIA